MCVCVRVGRRVKNNEGHYDVGQAKRLADLVAHCQIVRTKNKRKAFVNIMLRGGDGEAVKGVLYAAMEREGTRKWDSQPPKPVHKNLKDGLREARDARRR